jgi:hypothetical protein
MVLLLRLREAGDAESLAAGRFDGWRVGVSLSTWMLGVLRRGASSGVDVIWRFLALGEVKNDKRDDELCLSLGA